jgi:selenocysteine-specific elongation factor
LRRLILGTAGHIDHGKTALIKALTGIDTDRLEEEKARGISIDLGFAHLDLPDGMTLGVVDVPGHERFIKNMLAGVGGIDLVLFVVACDEGIMPQTTEHFDIVRLLGVDHAVFALTKADLVGGDMVELVREEVENLLKTTPLEGSPILPTSTKTGQGIEEIRGALERVAAMVEERRIGEATRLPIDRVFTMTGRGTVVTGTLWSGVISCEDRLEILPGDRPIRVRSVEVHGVHVDKAYAGQRTAVGVHGVEKQDVERGQCVVSPGDFGATAIVDAELGLLPAAPRSLKHGARIRFHLGASEVMGRLFLFDTATVGPGEKVLAQVRLEHPIVAAFGDRFVLRTYSPMRTVGGGCILDPLASRHKRRDQAVLERLKVLAAGDAKAAAEAHVMSSHSGARIETLRLKLNRGLHAVEAITQELVKEATVFEPSPGFFIHAEVLRQLENDMETVLTRYRSSNRLKWGMPREELRERMGSVDMSFFNWILGRLAADGRISIKKGNVRAGTGGVELSSEESQAQAMIIGLLKADLFRPPSERDLAGKSGVGPGTFGKVLALLIEDGTVVRLEPGLVVHAAAVDEARSRIVGYLSEKGEGTASDLKSVLGTTRKYAVPLLEHLDRMGVTRRAGDKRTLIP